jgi:cob(I)alamin adenosyltransferase
MAGMGIYTGQGDDGETDIRGENRVPKDNPRIEAYGTVDEINSLLGVICPCGHKDVDQHLTEIQNHLHILQANLASTDPNKDPCIKPEHTEWLESSIEHYNEELEPLTSFVLPGGSEAGGQLHHARTVCRRAERRIVGLSQQAKLNNNAMTYINRLSDALFTYARVVNKRENFREESPSY